MGSVWKRLNRINKRASKYQFTASYQELYLEAGPTWQPHSLSVVWTRRGRRVVADPVTWEPTMKSPYIGMCVWPVPDPKEITVTLYRDQRQEEYDNKDWFFVLEDVREGKRKPVAQGRLNLKDYAKSIPHQESIKIKLRPLNKKVSMCYLTFSLSSQFIKEGKATDDDMKSVASLMSNSTIPNNDIADLDTLIEDDEEAEKVSVPTSELAALTQSIRSMNEKLENLNPSVLPVRTLLQSDISAKSVPPKDPDPPPSLLQSTSQQPHQHKDTSRFPSLQPTSVEPQQQQYKNQNAVDNDDITADVDSEPLLGSYSRHIDPQPVIQPSNTSHSPQIAAPLATGVLVAESTPKKVPATPPRRRHSRNTSVSSPFFLPPVVSHQPPLQPPPLPARPTAHSAASGSGSGLTELSSRLEKIADVSGGDADVSTSSKVELEINKSLDASLVIDKSNGIITETVDVIKETASANQSCVSELTISAIVDDENNDSENYHDKYSTHIEKSDKIISDQKSVGDDSKVDIRIVSESKRSEKMQKSKSQEMREFTQAFVHSTVVDFDPMTFENTPPRPSNAKVTSSITKRTTASITKGSVAQPKVQAAITAVSDSAAVSDDASSSNHQDIHSEPKFKPVRLEFDDETTRKSVSPSRRSVSPLRRSPSPSNLAELRSPSPGFSRSKSPSPNSNENGHLEVAGKDSHTKFNSDRRGLVSSETSPNLSYLASGNGHSPSAEQQPPSAIVPPVTPKVGGIGASSDLLDWAKTNLANYSTVKVTNFTTSWRNGLAFCALIHNFYSDLVQFEDLNSHDIKLNNKIAFEAGEILGIPRVLEPENMAIRKIPDKLAVITYLHQLRSSLGTEETNAIYEAFKSTGQAPTTGMAIRKSFSEGNIKLFAKQNTIEGQLELPTVQEEDSTAGSDVSPSSTNNNVSRYRQKAKNLMESANLDSLEDSDQQLLGESLETSTLSTTSVTPSATVVSTVSVVRRQKSLTPKSKDSRLSYIDNEMLVLDSETQEIDRQAAILDRRIRECSEEDELVYDALLQQWFTLVNKKNTLIRRQMQLNILEKEDDLGKKFLLLQDELRMYSEMSESKKSEEDSQREELLLQELVGVVNQRNELVMQGEYEERMIQADQQIEQDVTLPEDRLVHNTRGGRDECKMQ